MQMRFTDNLRNGKLKSFETSEHWKTISTVDNVRHEVRPRDITNKEANPV